MVSLHSPLSPSRKKIIPDFENLFKKRKLNDDDDHPQDQVQKTRDHHHEINPFKGQVMIKSTPDTELHLVTPIPLEWQRCLDIKSGQLYFYNTRTNKRMLTDPRSSLEPIPPPPSHGHGHGHMSLDLELNLPCSSSYENQVTDIFTKDNSDITSNSSSDHHQLIRNSSTTKIDNNNNDGGLTRSPSWLTFEGEQEMVAAACKKCHMLVMMCKSSPSCPNCKFMHPLEPSTPKLLKPRLSLLC
ncbi:hypothetical protein ACH5RR_026857 [Cinchona calisaya]|uniref:WW domain-containing protein n=1 Tax=Cinchona calisaya TaxID=153742 RepID=A0ABD2Z748_9GENT